MARLKAQNMIPGGPAKPPGLPKVAEQAWDRIVQDVAESGIQIAKLHGRLIEQAALILAAMVDAQETVDTEGAYYDNPKTGAKQLHPATRRVDSLRRDYVKVLSLLGMRTPPGSVPTQGESMEDLLDKE